ncbi:hypothetical protein AC249_AIPGENE3512 [Exaiptasia diaphana]|nr:hypothetical protein AC249_AIPGENE3512 [Exaiptasia diaphana]
MSETFGKPFWLEEASREMRSAGVGDEESEPEVVADQEAEPSGLQEFLTVEEIMTTTYEPTMTTNTHSVPSKRMEIQEYLETEINRMRNTSVENHTQIQRTSCLSTKDMKPQEYLDTNRINGASTRKHIVNQTAENNKRGSEDKRSKNKQRRNRFKGLVKRRHRKILPEVRVPLKELLPKVVPLCYRVCSNVLGNAQLRSNVDPRYFNSKDLIHKNCFSYNLISAEIQARRQGILYHVRVTELAGKTTHPVFVDEPKLIESSALVDPSDHLPARTLDPIQEEEQDLLLLPQPLQPSSNEIEVNDRSLDSKANEHATPLNKELEHSASINSMPPVEEPSLEEITLEDVKASSTKYLVKASRHGVDSKCLKSSSKTERRGKGPGASQKSWAKRKLESFTACFRRKHSDQTASPHSDSTSLTDADSEVTMSPGTSTEPGAQDITQTNTAQKRTKGKMKKPHPAEEDTTVKSSAVQNRWLQLLSNRQKRRNEPANLPDIEIEMVQEPQEPVIRPAPVQPGKRRRRFNFWCFQCIYSPTED